MSTSDWSIQSALIWFALTWPITSHYFPGLPAHWGTETPAWHGFRRTAWYAFTNHPERALLYSLRVSYQWPSLAFLTLWHFWVRCYDIINNSWLRTSPQPQTPDCRQNIFSMVYSSRISFTCSLISWLPHWLSLVLDSQSDGCWWEAGRSLFWWSLGGKW